MKGDKFKAGETVEVSISGETWHSRIFLAEIVLCRDPYLCVAKSQEDEFNSGEKVRGFFWPNARRTGKRKYLLAIKSNGESQVFSFRSKRDRTMALNSMMKEGKVEYSLSELRK